ncbi:MAG: class II aldolase/adducin family protein [Candidatus Cloacimonetes bacterium]|nr:class II aldolase/adducin family protein [Candidatus Cloacimonadota bacterium]
MSMKIASEGYNLGTWGNISRRFDENIFAITPSAIPYKEMSEEHIVIVDLNCNVIEGNKKPSTEILLHSEIYRLKKKANAVIHTHGVFSTSFAIARKPIPAVCEDLIQVVGGYVNIADYHLPATKELAAAAIIALAERSACLLANHGLVSVAGNLAEAFKITQIVEKSAQAIILAQALGGAVELSIADINKMRNFYLEKYGK